MAQTAIIFPETQQWLGTAREAAAGTPVAPTTTMPVDESLPDDKPTYLEDKALRGDMAILGGMIQGTQIANLDPKGNIYLDTFPAFLYNILGDYTATGAAGSGSTTLTAPLTVGATTATVAAITGFSSGQAVQIGITADGNPEIVTLSAAPSGTTLTFTNTPARFAHASGKAVAGVVAPFVHIFSLLNTPPAQPVTHTLTHHQGITATYGARQYAYWCASQCDIMANVTELFKHSTKGLGILGQIPGAPVTNSFSSAKAQPSWELITGVAGPASGGTLVSYVQDLGVTINRDVKPLYSLQNQQAPYIIGRAGVDVVGKMTYLAQDESGLLALLNNTQPQLQYIISNGLTGANLLSMQIDMLFGAFDVAKLASSEAFLKYDITFKSVANTTNAGSSGGRSPIKITVSNAVPTY